MGNKYEKGEKKILTKKFLLLGSSSVGKSTVNLL